MLLNRMTLVKTNERMPRITVISYPDVGLTGGLIDTANFKLDTIGNIKRDQTRGNKDVGS